MVNNVDFLFFLLDLIFSIMLLVLCGLCGVNMLVSWVFSLFIWVFNVVILVVNDLLEVISLCVVLRLLCVDVSLWWVVMIGVNWVNWCLILCVLVGLLCSVGFVSVSLSLVCLVSNMLIVCIGCVMLIFFLWVWILMWIDVCFVLLVYSLGVGKLVICWLKLFC